MDIRPCGSVPSRRASQDWFTGTVWQDPIVDQTPAPARARAAVVRFEPGARTHWHRHPLGQTLYIVSGCGRVQTDGGPVQEVRAGDVVWFPPNEKHWHGAGPTTTMVHIAIHEALDGKHVEWLEPVSDQQYSQAAAT
jgi:quercetin dioxygenase-like cupin family protein